MTNPWLLWSLGLHSARMAAETFDASAKVIGHRSRILCAAARNPFAADHAELGLMVSEKVRALSAIGWTAVHDWSSLQRLWWEQVWALARVEALTAASAQSTMIEHAGQSMVRAIRPIHSTATANAKRLRRKSR